MVTKNNTFDVFSNVPYETRTDNYAPKKCMIYGTASFFKSGPSDSIFDIQLCVPRVANSCAYETPVVLSVIRLGTVFNRLRPPFCPSLPCT